MYMHDCSEHGEEKNMNETKRVLEDQEYGDEEEFEFFISWEGGEMCAAEDVFDHGRILPLYPSQPGRRSDCSRASCSSRRRVSMLMHHFHGLPSQKPQSGRRSSPVMVSKRGGWRGLLGLGLVQQPVVEQPKLRKRSVGKEMFKSGGDGGERWLAGLSCKCSEVVEETVQPVVRRSRTRRR